jgi:DnaJ-class molecular chaperone
VAKPKKPQHMICPECNGKGYEQIVLEKTDINSVVHIPCYYCAGTGYATDEEESFEEWWRA